MKAGWNLREIGEAFQTVTGNTPPKSAKHYYGNDVPLVKPPELTDGNVDCAVDGLSNSGAQVARVAPEGSVLVSCIGNLGKIGLATRPVAFNQQINAIYPDQTLALPRFTFYQTLSPQFREQLNALAAGTTVSIVNKSRFNSIRVALPPLEEQQRIVAVLDEAFEGLARARAHAEVNLQNARELLANLINTIMDAAGAENIRPLGELCRFENGDRGKNYPGRKAFVPEGVPFINAGHLLNGPIDWANMNYIPEEHYHRLSNGKVKQGDLLFCLRGSLGKFGVVDTDEAGAIASSLVIVRPSEALLGEYLSAYFESKACAKMIAEYAGGAAQPNLSAKSLAAFKIALPSLKDQARVVETIAEKRNFVELLILEYKTKLQDLDDLRQSLLQKAFAGELT